MANLANQLSHSSSPVTRKYFQYQVATQENLSFGDIFKDISLILLRPTGIWRFTFQEHEACPFQPVG